VDYLSSLRAKTGAALIPLVYGSAIVTDEAGRILFQHRQDFDVWGLPGGILEIGESPAECARREAREETGLQVDPLRVAAVLSGPRHEILYPNGDRVQQTTFFFECQITGGSLQAGRESSALHFFPADDLPPTLPWYATALADRNSPSQRDGNAPFFDPPESIRDAAAPSTWKMLRGRVGSMPLILPGATALIRDRDGRPLLVRRTDSGLWGLPGGFIELGENAAAAAIRETEEETGLRVEPLRIRGVFGGQGVVFPNGDTTYPISTWFECALRSGSLRPDGREIDRAEFHDPDRLPEIIPVIRDRLSAVLSSSGAVVFHRTV
jgi:ADP-ribose pyrophosphatase YjhB (NUDIX family)